MFGGGFGTFLGAKLWLCLEVCLVVFAVCLVGSAGIISAFPPPPRLPSLRGLRLCVVLCVCVCVCVCLVVFAVCLIVLEVCSVVLGCV